MFFVAGITGRVGGAAAQQLLNQGRKVRALVRDQRKAARWSEQGVELQPGDLNDESAIIKALKDVEGAFIMLPPYFAPAPGFPEARAIVANLHQALRQTRPPRVVALSSIGSEKSSGLGLISQTHLLEEAIGEMPSPIAFIRAGSFFENYSFALEAAASSGSFDTYFTPGHAVPMVATEDIGKEVARLLLSGWTGKKVIELGSPASPDDLAIALSDVLGRPVQARAVPRDQWAASLEAQGVPHGGTGAFEEMEDGFNSGWIKFGVAGTESIAASITPPQFFHRLQKASVAS